MIELELNSIRYANTNTIKLQPAAVIALMNTNILLDRLQTINRKMHFMSAMNKVKLKLTSQQNMYNAIYRQSSYVTFIECQYGSTHIPFRYALYECLKVPKNKTTLWWTPFIYFKKFSIGLPMMCA